VADPLAESRHCPALGKKLSGDTATPFADCLEQRNDMAPPTTTMSARRTSPEGCGVAEANCRHRAQQRRVAPALRAAPLPSRDRAASPARRRRKSAGRHHEGWKGEVGPLERVVHEDVVRRDQVLDGAGVFDRGRRVGHDHSGAMLSTVRLTPASRSGSGSEPGLRRPRTPSPAQPAGATTPRSLRAALLEAQPLASAGGSRSASRGSPGRAPPCPSGQADPRDSAIATVVPGGDPCSESYGRGTCGRHWTAGRGSTAEGAPTPRRDGVMDVSVTFDPVRPLLADPC